MVSLAEAQLSKVEADGFIKKHHLALAAKRSVEMKEVKDGFQYFEVQAAGKTMRCVGRLYGKDEKGKRALYLSMHGGGGAPARVNDQQWNNQIGLYKPKEGWYVAPRAPSNTWNLWHEPHIDALFGRLIEDMVATRGVDPNRVYLMGYSAGGDGVYQLAPRMADRFGAATMMAGHPNDASPDGLMNLPFRIYMGGKDAAYKRNEVAAEWGRKLKALKEERGGYEHKVTIYPEMGHWMERKDAEAVPWMGSKTRKAWPKKVVWGKSGTRSERFYWLGGKPKDVVKAEVEGQKVIISGSSEVELQLYLNDELVNLDEAITVIRDGKEVFSGKVGRTRKAIRESLAERLDPVMAATAILKVPVGKAEKE
jgi:hypothetical protein